LEQSGKKSFVQTVRGLHRDVGYLLVGLTLVFVLSGIAQIFRNTNFLQQETQHAIQLEPGLAPDALGPALRMREVRVERTEGSVSYFRGGSYDAATGRAVRTEKSYVFPIDRLSDLHTVASSAPVHWLTLLYAILLAFMTTSSFFMFRAGHALQRRGLLFAAIGLVVAIAALLLAKGGD
jgi:hypothetical protein